MAKDNKTLGRFELTDIVPAPRGTPKIEVSFDIDSNSIIHVSAKDKYTGKEQNIQISRPNLSEEEIKNMVREASIYEEADQERKQMVTAKNELDQACYQSEKLLKDNKDKIEPDAEESFSKLLKEAKELLGKEEPSLDDLQSMKEKLLKEMQSLGAEIYKKSGAADDDDDGAGGFPGGGGGADSDGADGGKTGKNGAAGDEPIDVNYDKKE